jgi:NhaA family Na+:H+ antiporter
MFLKSSLLHPKTRPFVGRLTHPFQAFVHAETSSGVLLLCCTLFALLWANSPWAQSYHQVWENHLAVRLAGMELDRSLHVWINDGLMTLFFVLVGLEIKREVLVGELAQLRQALLPLLAACGGALVPALIYTAFTWGTPAVAGWGSAMATDIAFALGILFLLGKRVPSSLRIFLTALAIVDDLLAVLVIALFYSQGINWFALAGAGILVLVLVSCNVLDIRHSWIYVVLGLLLWLAVFQSGVHATIAGVLFAFTIPARSRIDAQTFVHQSREVLDNFEQGRALGLGLVMDDRQQAAVRALETAAEAIQAPLQRMEHSLHLPVSYLVIPLFVLANAGVSLQGMGFVAALTSSVSLGVVIGLVLGKQLGITLASWLAIRLGWADRPSGVSFRHLYGVSWLGGIGFTMSLLIADLAFGSAYPELLDQAKVGILLALVLASLGGYLILRFFSGFHPSGPKTCCSNLK